MLLARTTPRVAGAKHLTRDQHLVDQHVSRFTSTFIASITTTTPFSIIKSVGGKTLSRLLLGVSSSRAPHVDRQFGFAGEHAQHLLLSLVPVGTSSLTSLPEHLVSSMPYVILTPL